MTTYATYADLEHALDSQIIGQLCGDAGVALNGPNAVTEAALERGTASVRSYIRVGGIYSEAEISSLAAANDALLVGLVVDLATEFLFQRRGAKLSPAIEQRIKQAYTFCEGLRDGKMLFGDASSNVSAGTPLVTAVSTATNAFYAGVSTSRFFPPRRGTTSQ